MIKCVFAVFFIFLLLSSSIQAQYDPNSIQNQLGSPIKVNLYYNNQSQDGYILYLNDMAFLSINSAKNLLNFNDKLNTVNGTYDVNGKIVGKFYYGNTLYLNLLDFASAVGLSPRYTSDKLGIIFLKSKQSANTMQKKNFVPQCISMNIISQRKGLSSDPVNNISYTFNMSLVNRSQNNIALNHFNFILIGMKGQKYVSIKSMGYVIVFGENDTPDILTLDPFQEHIVNVTFEVPDWELPRTIIIQKNENTLGTFYIQG